MIVLEFLDSLQERISGSDRTKFLDLSLSNESEKVYTLHLKEHTVHVLIIGNADSIVIEIDQNSSTLVEPFTHHIPLNMQPSLLVVHHGCEVKNVTVNGAAHSVSNFGLNTKFTGEWKYVLGEPVFAITRSRSGPFATLLKKFIEKDLIELDRIEDRLIKDFQ